MPVSLGWRVLSNVIPHFYSICCLPPTAWQDSSHTHFGNKYVCTMCGAPPSIILSSSRHRAEIGDGGFLCRAWNRRRHVRPLAARWLGCGAWRGGDNLNAAPINRVNGRDLVQFHPNSEARTGPWRDSVLGLSSVVFIQWRKILAILQSVYSSPSNLQWFQSNSIHHYHILNTIHRSISSSPILLHL